MSAFNSSTGVPSTGLRLVSTSECDCLDQTLTYECTVTGSPGGATVWTGSALNCPSGEIVLLHRHFTNPDGTIRTCDNGAIVAQSLSVQNNLYTTQLNITVTQNIIRKNITCIYDGMGDGTVNQSQFSTQIQGNLRAAIHEHVFKCLFSYSRFTCITQQSSH